MSLIEDGVKQIAEDEKPKEPEIVCMPTSIKVFRIYGGFPPKGQLLNPGKLFYFRFVITAVYSSLILVGSILHLVQNIKGRSKKYLYFFVFIKIF